MKLSSPHLASELFGFSRESQGFRGEEVGHQEESSAQVHGASVLEGVLVSAYVRLITTTQDTKAASTEHHGGSGNSG